MRLRLATLLLGAAALATAAEEKTTSDAPAPAPLDAAKRDYAELKASRLSVGQEKPGLSGASTPELHLNTEPTLSFPSGGRGPGQKNGPGNRASSGLDASRGKNWLVDAMAAAGSKKKEGETEEKMEDKQAETSDPAHPIEAGPNELEPRRETARLERPEIRAENPLEGFLASWMTPGDYKLLKNTPDRDTFGERVGAGAANMATVPGGEPRAMDLAGPGAASTPTRPAGAGAANPYLQELSAPATENVLRPLPPPAALPPPRVAPPIPANPAPAKPAEVFKPRDDDKYFPQLKRF